MVLVDSSVWIDHFRKGNDQLVLLLDEGQVFCHHLIIGELSCGNLKKRNQILSFLHDLPQSVPVNHDEVLVFIENNKLMGKGLGYIDVCLLASAVLSDLRIWTLDIRLKETAQSLGLSYRYD
jgi:predicted nucleic acid-binding protein